MDIGRSDEPRFEHHYAKWWIYLTNWGLMSCAVQAWLGAMIVTQGLMVDRDDFGKLFVGIRRVDERSKTGPDVNVYSNTQEQLEII